MTINFSWGGGQMSIDAELLILEMPMSNYRKWVKLFAAYGEPDDHRAFLQLLDDQIQGNAQAIKEELDTKKLPPLRRMLKKRQSMKDVMMHELI